VGLLAAGSVALIRAEGAGDPPFGGGSYLATLRDSDGNFQSRIVLTLHADHTMSVVDATQGGPTYHFSSQSGSWKIDSPGHISARTIDFDYPPDADVARLDWGIALSPDQSHIAGTMTIWTYPLESNDVLRGQGTFLFTDSMTGELITP
jgi:hypothetical protein